MDPSLTELLAVLSPTGALIVAGGVFLKSEQSGRALVDDVLRGAGLGTLAGTSLALIAWGVERLLGA